VNEDVANRNLGQFGYRYVKVQLLIFDDEEPQQTRNAGGDGERGEFIGKEVCLREIMVARVGYLVAA